MSGAARPELRSGPFLPGARPHAGRARVPAARGGAGGGSVRAGAGGSGFVTRRRKERAERPGRGGAESSAEQPLPAAAADPGPRPRLALWTGARCCSLSRSRCVGWVGGAGTAPAAALRRWAGPRRRSSQRAAVQSPLGASSQAPSPTTLVPCLTPQGRASQIWVPGEV